jgi:hypothetical protein
MYYPIQSPALSSRSASTSFQESFMYVSLPFHTRVLAFARAADQVTPQQNQTVDLNPVIALVIKMRK